MNKVVADEYPLDFFSFLGATLRDSNESISQSGVTMGEISIGTTSHTALISVFLGKVAVDLASTAAIQHIHII